MINDAGDERENRHSGEGEMKWVTLTNVANDIEFETVASLLRIADIPCIRKIRGVDGFITVIIGVPIGGIEVLVPEDRLEEAGQLLNAEVEDEELEK